VVGVVGVTVVVAPPGATEIDWVDVELVAAAEEAVVVVVIFLVVAEGGVICGHGLVPSKWPQRPFP